MKTLQRATASVPWFTRSAFIAGPKKKHEHESAGASGDGGLGDPRICTGGGDNDNNQYDGSEDVSQPLACGRSKFQISRRSSVLMMATSRGLTKIGRVVGEARMRCWRACHPAPVVMMHHPQRYVPTITFLHPTKIEFHEARACQWRPTSTGADRFFNAFGLALSGRGGFLGPE